MILAISSPSARPRLLRCRPSAEVLRRRAPGEPQRRGCALDERRGHRDGPRCRSPGRRWSRERPTIRRGGFPAGPPLRLEQIRPRGRGRGQPRPRGAALPPSHPGVGEAALRRRCRRPAKPSEQPGVASSRRRSAATARQATSGSNTRRSRPIPCPAPDPSLAGLERGELLLLRLPGLAPRRTRGCSRTPPTAIRSVDPGRPGPPRRPLRTPPRGLPEGDAGGSLPAEPLCDPGNQGLLRRGRGPSLRAPRRGG